MDGNIKHEPSHALIGKYLSGACSPEEAAAAQAWIQASPENGQTYAALEKIWLASQAEAHMQVDVDAAWRKVQARMQAPAQATLPMQPARKGFLRQWWIAAAAALVISIGTYVIWRTWQQAPAAQEMTWAAGETPLRDTLPDGSIVTLNAHSRLVFPAQFAGAATRAVRLEGEAFFDVHRDPAQPFVITAGATEVRVLGTSFNVKETEAAVSVSVTEGKVRFAAAAAPAAVELAAGTSATFAAATRKIVRDSLPDANASYWLTGRLVFQDKPLSAVVAELSARWKKPVLLADPGIGNCRLTATFDHPSIESTLQMIAETFNLEVAQDATSFTLSGTACQ
jgi:transmembrane sensor